MRVEDLERELRAERPEVELEFARKLDEWAAAGFPRGGELDPRPGAGGRFAGIGTSVRGAWGRLSSVPPRRILGPAGALATLVVVGGVAIGQLGESGADDEALSGAPAVRESAPAAGGERAVEDAQAPAAPALSGDDDEAGAGAGTAPRPAESAQASPAAPLGDQAGDLASPTAPTDVIAPEPIPPGGGEGLARGAEKRIQDATARISLGAEADEVQEVANGVVAVTDRNDGIVLDSQVTSDQGGARASFELEIPFNRLDQALTELSELGDVISRTEAAEDITGRAVRARQQLADTFEQIRELRVDLIRADSREQRLVIKSQISSLEATADVFQTELRGVKREGRFATVSVDVTSSGPGSDDGSWGLDDALDDAGDVLTTLGGIALVSLAILVPVGVVAAIAYAIASGARRRGRERALDD